MSDEKRVFDGPMYYIQSDWEDSLNKVSGEIWITCKHKNKGSKHGRVTRTNSYNDDNTSAVNVTEGFIVNFLTHNAIQVASTDSKNSNIFVAARGIYSSIHAKSITSLDISQESTCVSISSENENSVSVWSADNEAKLLTFSEHVAAAYRCRWFPSGKVVLSCGSDMSLKIWCSETGRCPVTLIGHTRGVTDVAFVERGRNVISVSKDGCCKLWDCSEGHCIVNLISGASALNCCSLAVIPETLMLPSDAPTNDREIGTDDKILLLGAEDGSIYCIAVRSRKVLFSLKLDSAINCCCHIKSDLFAVGCQNGGIHLISVEKVKVLVSWCETNSPVLCAMSYKGKGFFVGHNDGSCVYRSTENPSAHKLLLSGSDGDPIYDICYDNKFIYTACRDSNVRKYSPDSYICRYFDLGTAT